MMASPLFLLSLLGSCWAAGHPPPRSYPGNTNPFRFLVSRTRSPYSYQTDPLARVALHRDSPGYMMGEEFFKQDSIHFDREEDKFEEMPYDVVQDNGNYVLRRYPSVSLVCTTHKKDLAADEFAGLENFNPWRIMQSRRYQKTPSSIMFKRLFKYISGVNQEEKEIEMTRPVTNFVKVVKEDNYGDLVKMMMCFYLPSEYQPNHKHQTKGITGVILKPAPRHDSLPAPEPMQDSKVFLYTRPEMEVYVHRFGGFAMTSETWVKHHNTLMDDLIGKQVKGDEYFTVGYDSPFQMENRRNEVWVQSTQGEAADMAAVLDNVVWEE